MGAYHLFCLFVAFPLVASQASPNFDQQWDIRCSRESDKEIILSWYPLQLSEAEVAFYNVSTKLDNYYWWNFTTTDLTHKIPVAAGEKFVASVTPIIEKISGVRYAGVPATTELNESTATYEAPTNVVLNEESNNEVSLSWDRPKRPILTDYMYSVLYHNDKESNWIEKNATSTALSISFKSNPQAVRAKVAIIANSVKSDYIWANWLNKNPFLLSPRWIAMERTISTENLLGPIFHHLPPINVYDESDQSVPSNVTLVQVSSNEAILSWNPPIKKEGEILGYEVLYTSGQTTNKINLRNVTRFSMRFGNEASAIEASVAATTENNVNSQRWHFSKIVRIEVSTTGNFSAISDEPTKIDGLVIALIVFLVILILAVIIAAIVYFCFGKKGLYKVREEKN